METLKQLPTANRAILCLAELHFIIDCQVVFRSLRAAMKKEAGHEEHEGYTKATKRNEKAAVHNPPSQKIGRGLDALPRVMRLAEDPSRGEGPFGFEH